MQLCPSSLPTLPNDMQQRWDADPAAAVRLLLDNEARQGEQYRDCAARHSSLVDWVLEK